MKKVTKNYVNNEALLKAMKIYKAEYDKGLPPSRANYDYIGVCINLIANRMTNHPWFIGYTPAWKEEMIYDGIENCIMYIYNFDAEKFSNPFAYFTQIVYFAFRRRLEKERKQQYIKLKLTENFFLENDLNGEIDLKVETLYDNNYEFIRQYEKSLTDKKKKTKITGVEKFL